jgi:4-amino-4-deoxy-L-arabinose transferase-like glycosyltransferase
MKLQEASDVLRMDFAGSANVSSDTAVQKKSGLYLPLVGIALAALLIRLLPLMLESGSAWTTANNSEAYTDLAEGFQHGCGFAAWTGTKCASPEVSRTPGYPLLLALLPSTRAAVAVQALLWSALCLAIGVFAARRWGASAGIIACLLLALDLPSFVYSNKIMTEVPFSFLFAAAVLAELKVMECSRFDRKLIGLVLLSGLLFACATAVRPIAQMVVPLALLFALLMWRGDWRQKLAVGLLLVLFPVLLIGGWKYRNWKETGISAFSTVSAFNLYNFRAAGTVAYATGRSLQTVWRSWDQSHPESFARRGFEIIRQHPMAFAAMTSRTFVYLALVPDRGPLARVLGIEQGQKVEDPGSIRIDGALDGAARSPLHTAALIYRNELDSSSAFAALIILQLAMTALVWMGAVYAAVSEVRSRPAWDVRILFMLVMALWLLFLASGPEATDRFRIPAMPLLAMVSAIGWYRAWSDWRRVAPACYTNRF